MLWLNQSTHVWIWQQSSFQTVYWTSSFKRLTAQTAPTQQMPTNHTGQQPRLLSLGIKLLMVRSCKTNSNRFRALRLPGWGHMLTQPEVKEQPEITGQLRAARSPEAHKKVQFKVNGHHQKQPFTASCMLYIHSSVPWLPCSCSFHPYNNREVLLRADTSKDWKKKLRTTDTIGAAATSRTSQPVSSHGNM